MTFAACVGSYSLPHFISLQILSLRHVFGDIPILISDDKSSESPVIESVAEKYNCHFCTSTARRGHFAGDVSAVCNALQFARQCNAEIAVKISQRLVLVNPLIRERAEWYLSQPGIAVALPGNPPAVQLCSSRGFSRFPLMTDVIFLRPDRVDAETIRDGYEAAWQNGKTRHDCVPELAFAAMRDGVLKDKIAVFNELTSHHPDKAKLFHRRSMSTPAEFRRFANSLGIDGWFSTADWSTMDKGYKSNCRPKA